MLVEVKDSDGNFHNAWNVSDAFNPLQYIKNLWFRRPANKEFVQNFIAENFSDLNRGDIIAVKTLRYMNLVEGLFLKNGSSYICHAACMGPTLKVRHDTIN